MNDDPFKHFKTPEDYARWNNYIEQAKSSASLTPENAVKAESAFQSLRKHLGDDAWLSKAFEIRHPLAVGYLINFAPWTRSVLIRMAEAMEAFGLKKNSNYNRVRDRLKRPGTFSEAQSVLETGYKFLLRGFEVAFDPSVTIFGNDGTPKEKVPDLKITSTDTGEEIFVEVSALGFSNQHQQISNAERIIFFQLLDAIGFEEDIIMRACAYKAPDEATLKNIVEEIKKLAAEVRACGSFETWTSEGVIELAAAPADQSEVINRWAAERGIGQGELIKGALIDLNDPKRLILDKIGKEVKQLPKDRPGMIVVTTTQNFLFHTYSMEMIGELLSTRLQRYPQLACAAVTYCHYVDSEEAPIAHVLNKAYSIREWVISHPLLETTLLAHNSACQQPFSELTSETICQAFAGLPNLGDQTRNTDRGARVITNDEAL